MSLALRRYTLVDICCHIISDSNINKILWILNYILRLMSQLCPLFLLCWLMFLCLIIVGRCDWSIYMKQRIMNAGYVMYFFCIWTFSSVLVCQLPYILHRLSLDIQLFVASSLHHRTDLNSSQPLYRWAMDALDGGLVVESTVTKPKCDKEYITWNTARLK